MITGKIPEPLKEKLGKKPISRNMGLGPISASGYTFPRTFRWLFYSPGYEYIRHWCEKLKVDYVNKIIELNIMDDMNGGVFDWLSQLLKQRDMNAKEIRLEHLNGLGQIMYWHCFSDCEVKSHESHYDYSSNNVITNKITIAYNTMHRHNGQEGLLENLDNRELEPKELESLLSALSAIREPQDK